MGKTMEAESARNAVQPFHCPYDAERPFPRWFCTGALTGIKQPVEVPYATSLGA